MLDLFRDLGYPEVPPVPEGVDRPTWSVMIPTYNCAGLLRETLRCVLAQDPGPEHMQIEVVDDASTKDDPEAVVREEGGGRIAFHRHPQNVGATANFNACLSRSRGQLVHVLHGDDLVLPGFYDRMQGLLDRHEEAVAAICRFAFMDEDGVWLSLVAPRQRQAGIYPEALASLAGENWGQFAAVVLRRSLVESVGGFHPSLIHAADWDMWKRAAWRGPVAYEPGILACYRTFTGSDSSRLMRTGANIADIGRAIELSSGYLPTPESGAWIARARRHFADYARRVAERMVWSGDLESARNQLCAAAALHPASAWSRAHLDLRYTHMKQTVKRGLMGWRVSLVRDRAMSPAADHGPVAR